MREGYAAIDRTYRAQIVLILFDYRGLGDSRLRCRATVPLSRGSANLVRPRLHWLLDDARATLPVRFREPATKVLVLAPLRWI